MLLCRDRKGRVSVLFLSLLSLAILYSGASFGQDWFDLGRYEEMKRDDPAGLTFILQAMYETAFYAESAQDKPVICATPLPIPGERLIEAIDREVAQPSNPLHLEYDDSDHVAFVLMNALKTKGVCE
jgi:hypothetical protein